MVILKRLILFLISIAIFGYVIYFITPPKDWEEASTLQILIFFLPFLGATTFLVNIFLNHLPRSFLIGLGIIMLSVLKAINQLTSINFSLIVLVVSFLVVMFKKPSKKNLTPKNKIPKLTHI